MANSQHRPGANVSHSPVSYAREKMKRADTLEKQLSSLTSSSSTSKNKSSEEQAQKLRMRLCEVLSDIVLTEPQFSMKHDCIGRLWRSCFYNPLGQFRQRVAREKRKKGPNVAKLEKSLKSFLGEAITLYDYLISQYHAKLLPPSSSHAFTCSSSMTPPDSSQDSLSQSSIGDSQPVASTDTTGVVPGLYRMYIHLGDLHRYNASYHQAQVNYGNAAKLAPGQGNPYNQLAVVAQLKDAAAPLNAVALYWYARSLLPTHDPFEISKANLARLFQSNREWFHKQPSPVDDVLKPAGDGNNNNNTNGGGGRELAKAQRTVASRHFLSQFVDLHYSFFQGLAAAATSATTVVEEHNTTEKEKDTKCRLTDEDVVKQIEAIVGPFAVLLRASAFGDSLLCKMVAICAFSESYNPHSDDTKHSSQAKPAASNRSKATTILARTFTLAFGACLAERAAVGIAKIKDQPEKMGNPGKAPPSVRLLLPLLLLCEYVESYPIDLGLGKEKNPALSPRARAFCEKIFDTFWQGVVDVMNILTTLREPLQLVGGQNWKNASLKEFNNLIGYAPFQSILNDTMLLNREDGFASVQEAVDVLELAVSSTQETNTQQSSTQDSLSGGGTQTVEEYKIKVGRFLSFGDRMAVNNDYANDVGLRFERTPDGSYNWREKQVEDERMESDNDNPMMDVENVEDNETQPPAAKGADVGGEVLTYSVPEGGGPALLVPGMLLQSRALATLRDGDNAVREPRPKVPSIPVAQNFPGLSTAANGNGMAVEPIIPQAAPAKLPASIMPPPGFGGGAGLSSIPAAATAIGPSTTTAAIPPGNFAIGSHHSAPPFAAPMVGASNTVMPPGLGQAFVPVMQHESYQPTIGGSLDLFGGPEALRTDNPFAFSSIPSIDANAGVPFRGLGGNNIDGTGPFFLGSGASGAPESTLFGSGLLSSLFDDSADTTKNPFASR